MSAKVRWILQQHKPNRKAFFLLLNQRIFIDCSYIQSFKLSKVYSIVCSVSQSVSQSVSHSISQSVSQSVSQSISHSINQMFTNPSSINQSHSKLFNKSSINQSHSKLFNKSSSNQSVSKSLSQSIIPAGRTLPSGDSSSVSSSIGPGPGPPGPLGGPPTLVRICLGAGQPGSP